VLNPHRFGGSQNGTEVSRIGQTIQEQYPLRFRRIGELFQYLSEARIAELTDSCRDPLVTLSLRQTIQVRRCDVGHAQAEAPGARFNRLHNLSLMALSNYDFQDVGWRGLKHFPDRIDAEDIILVVSHGQSQFLN
jgi:hypothetical protein